MTLKKNKILSIGVFWTFEKMIKSNLIESVKNGQHMNVMSEYINFGKINDQKVAVAYNNLKNRFFYFIYQVFIGYIGCI